MFHISTLHKSVDAINPLYCRNYTVTDLNLDSMFALIFNQGLRMGITLDNDIKVMCVTAKLFLGRIIDAHRRLHASLSTS
jgi:hypothetical protein